MSVASPPFAPSADRRNALDRAHRGDIEGALGTVRSHDTGPRLTLRRKLLPLLGVIGPGLVVMIADNDAGTISVFSQAGHDHGLAVLWVLAILCPGLYITQEMVARLGAVTGCGHARLTLERFGRLWCAFSLADLLILNFAMLVTEFIGVTLALGYFGISPPVAVGLSAPLLIAATCSGSFRRWERAMGLMILADLALVPLAIGASGAWHGGAGGGIVRPVTGSGPGGMALLAVALIGTTIAPWQLFFHQSSVVDKRITPRWLRYERIDTGIGAVLFGLCAAAALAIGVIVAGPLHGPFTDVGVVARALSSHVSPAAGAVFAIALFNASLLAAGAVSLSGSYAVSEVVGVRHSLHRSFGEARVFHGSFAALVAIAAATVLIPGLPRGAVITLVQALTGILLPSTLILLLLLCNDRDLLGPMRNGRRLNLVAGSAIFLILGLSTLLAVTTALPRLKLAEALILTGVLLSAGGVPLAVAGLRSRRRRSPEESLTPWQRLTWSSPPLELIRRPARTSPRVIALVLIRVYVLVVVGLLAIRLGHPPLG